MHSSLHTPVPRAKRGAVLIVSLLFSAIIALSLGSFIRLATSASQISNRTYFLGVSMNIAESGLEHAMWAINRTTKGDANAWDNWDDAAKVGSAEARTRTFDMGNIQGGAHTQVKVYARDRNGTASPLIIARSIVTPPRGAPIEKWIRVTLSRRSIFSIGALGEDGITLKGNNVGFGSWDSDPDNDPNTPYVLPNPGNIRANASLATTSFDASVDAGNGDVRGTAAVGSDDLNKIKVGAQGSIGPEGTPNGVIDPNSVSTDFTADLERPVAPTASYTSLGAITDNLTLPRDTETPVDGVYYYSATQLHLNNATLSITPGNKVVLHVDNNMSAIDIGGGSGSIKVGGTLTTNVSNGVVTYVPSSLHIYTPGDVDIGGKGSANEVDRIDHKPANSIPTSIATTTTTTPISPIYGKGLLKTVIIGWTMRETITRVTTVGTNSPTTVTSTRTYSDTGILSLPLSTSVGPIITYSDASTPDIYTLTGTQAGQPDSFHLYGTRTNAQTTISGPQTIKIAGNGNLSGVINAPNADVSARGGGNSGFIYGSMIARSILFTGNDSFYYDEALAKKKDESRLGIESWNELVTYANRNTYGSLMKF